MRAAFQHFVDFSRGNAFAFKETVIASRGLNSETHFNQLFHRWQNAGAIGFLHGNKHSATQWHAVASTQLGFGEGHVVSFVEAHHFTRRAHFWA